MEVVKTLHLLVFLAVIREAIGSLMSQLQEVRASRDSAEARVSSLRKELQDTSRELGESLLRNNRQVSQSSLITGPPLEWMVTV